MTRSLARPCLVAIAALTVFLPLPLRAERAIGTNLAVLRPGSSEWAFVDLFHQASTWIPQVCEPVGPWDTGEVLQLTPDGWPILQPGQAAGAVIAAVDGRYPGGQYLCLYEGSGTIEFHLDATVIDSQPGQMVVEVQPENLIHVKITASDPSNPIRNIRLIMPGFWENYTAQLFHPVFLERLAPYSTIRFMDWQRTNTTPVTSWSDRATPDQPTQTTEAGVALEYMIELANRTGKSPWFCIPHLADDDYVEQFATLVRDQLDPAIPAYIEYSNECWNSAFPQAAYCQQRGLALGLSEDPFHAQILFYSQRAVEIFTTFENVFGGTDRLVRVLGAQLATPWVGQQVSAHQNAYLKADAVAVNPYMGISIGTSFAPLTEGWQVDNVLAVLQDELPSLGEKVAEYAGIASTTGLELIAYEGGQHLVGVGALQSNVELANLFHEANRAEGMYDVYRDLLDTWSANGGGLFMHYHATELPNLFGSWGALEYQDQCLDEAPKYRALIDYAGSNFVRGDCNQDGRQDLSDQVYL
ncbi:MAG: hypothetical protein KDC38_20520, partial [Planctomycetes bacterium]|nr:hypothetical protein [Planctomycetota bacterium]